MSEDPNGVKLGEPGCKLDKGKVELSFAIDGFPFAMACIARVGMFGAYEKRYGVDAWKSLKNGSRRYHEAALRHENATARGEECDPESGLPHRWHAIWNRLAELEFLETEAHNKGMKGASDA